MKRMMALTGVAFLVGILLLGCSDKDEASIRAEKEDFEHVYYEAGRYKLSLQDNILMIVGKYDPMDKKYTFDDLVFSEGAKSGDSIEKEYKNVHVKTEGSTYHITAEDLNLTLEKFADHIIKDEEGNEFIKMKIVQ